MPTVTPPSAGPARTRVVGYIRVSTEHQADEGVSLEAQRARLEAFALATDLVLVGVEVDAGISAKTLERPGIQRALARLEAGEADGVLVAKLDRSGLLLWSNPATWGGSVPAAGAAVTISSSQSVLLDVVTPLLGSLVVQGSLVVTNAPTYACLSFSSVLIFRAVSSTRTGFA